MQKTLEPVVFYVGNFKPFLMDAQCQLVLGNSMILRDMGYKVVLIGNESSEKSEKDVSVIEGFDCYNVEFNKSLKGLAESYLKHCELCEIFSRYEKPAMIINYGTYGFAIQLWLLWKWCKKNRIPLISNQVDLSSLAHGTFIERVIKHFDVLIKKRVTLRSNGIIGVTEYICDYYKKDFHAPTTVIPPLKKKIEEYEINKTEDLVTIVYVGVPFPIDGRKVDEEAYKDRIDKFIDLLLRVKDRVRDFKFNLYGLTQEQYLRVVDRHSEIIKNCGDRIKFFGRIDYAESLEVMKKADFSVVYRDVNEMNQAGFSSKLVESIACGTPVIMTDTGDYTKYLKDGENCFVLDPTDPQKEQDRLVEILNMDDEAIMSIKNNCREQDVFNYERYIDRMSGFVNEVNNYYTRR
ncbi:MAG: glycosyltransferase family 4 protein [Lachnospiraceae bacterium]|nr:glycosyltransferase family 4 protein [Lachnospiraceae bacterium]